MGESNKIAVVGRFFPEDWDKLPISHKYAINHHGNSHQWMYPIFSLIEGKCVKDSELLDVAGHFSEHKVVIFPAFGHSLSKWCGRFVSCGAVERMRESGVKFVWWSFDTHIWHSEESRYREVFDAMYSMHPQFAKCDTKHAAACVAFTSGNRMPSLMPTSKVHRVAFYARHYEWSSRTEFWINVKRKLHGIPIDNNKVEHCEPYFSKLAESTVAFNASVGGEVNIRNFEALGANCALVTERHPQLEAIVNGTPLQGSTYFYQRGNVDDAVRAVNEALAMTYLPKTQQYIIDNHLLANRVAQIVEEQCTT